MVGTLDRRPPVADQTLFNVTMALLVVGIVAVYDSSYARSMDAGIDGFFYLKKQAIYAGIGIAGMILAMRCGYWKLRGWAGMMLAASIVLLCMVHLPMIGIYRNGAARWIGYGQFQIQPSEVAKLALIVYLAAILSKSEINIRRFWDGLAMPLGIIGIVVLLVEREPDLGTAVVIWLTGLTLLYLAGARLKHIVTIAMLGCAAILIVSMVGHGFRQSRIKVWLDPEKYYDGPGYQVVRGLVAVGSGGIKGVGIGAGREKLYLPEANTDFVFATIAEETGLWGGVLVIGLLFMIARQGINIARRTRDPFGALMAGGIAAVISWQAVINIAVVTGSIPATGVPLPFVSYGGTSLLFLLIGIGILLNISQHPDGVKR